MSSCCELPRLPSLHNHAAQTPVFIPEDASLATLLLYSIVHINQ